jgi:hypothetical protein
MKKVLLSLVFMFMCFSSNAQKITKDFLTGEWESETVILNFEVKNNKDLYIEAYSKLGQKYFKMKSYQFNKGYFYLEMIYEPNNWNSIAKFIMVDNNTMVADYVSDAPSQMIYKRKLNN